MNLRAFSFILLVLVMLSSCRSPSTTWNPTGVGDIDQIRIEILESPTDTLNALERMVFGSVARRVTQLPYHAKMFAFSDVKNGGEIQWTYRGGGGLTTPVVTEDKLIFGSSADVFLTCLDPESGEMKWRFYTGGEMMENGPALYGNKIYAHCKNGWLYAIK